MSRNGFSRQRGSDAVKIGIASVAKVCVPAVIVIVPLVAAAFWMPAGTPSFLQQVLLFLWGVGAILVAERLVFSETVSESLGALGFVRARVATVLIAVLVSLPMWAFLPMFAWANGMSLDIRPGWAQLLVGVVLMNGITEEAIHRGFVFGHLHTSSNTPAIVLALPQDVMATALVMHMGVILVSMYLVFLLEQRLPVTDSALPHQ